MAPLAPCPDCGRGTQRFERRGADVTFRCRCGWERDYLAGEDARRREEQRPLLEVE